MIKGDYPYPSDEFDAVDPSQGPRGVHRRPRGRWATLAPYGAALVLSAALALVLIGVLWDERTPLPVTLPEIGLGETAAPPPTGAAASPASGGTPSATREPTVDLGAPVRVLNSTSVAGLAADAAGRLADAGWTDVRTGDFPAGALETSLVRFATPDLEGSARQVADVLGIDGVEPADEPADGEDPAIEVVLGRDATG